MPAITVSESLAASRMRVSITNQHGAVSTICFLGSFVRDCRAELPKSWHKFGAVYIARQIQAFDRCTLNLGRAGIFSITKA